MRRNVAGLIVVFIGAAILQVAVSDTYLRYVKPAMRPMLLAAGAVLILLAVIDVLADTRRAAHAHSAADDHEHADDDGPGHTHGHGHSHHGLPRAAWLLLLPVFALLVIDPPALGADAAQRQSPVATKPIGAAGNNALLPDGDPATPVALSVRDYAVWAVWNQESLQNRTFKLTGFVTPRKDGTWYVTRIGLACCVADGTAFMVEVRNQPAPAIDQWVEVIGEWAEPTAHPDGAIAAVQATSVRQVSAPTNPYE